MMKKNIGFTNISNLRESILKIIQSKKTENVIITNEIKFIDKKILIKPIDYYYTNSIARSSKVMSECREISKKYLFTGIEKVS